MEWPFIKSLSLHRISSCLRHFVKCLFSPRKCYKCYKIINKNIGKIVCLEITIIAFEKKIK